MVLAAIPSTIPNPRMTKAAPGDSAWGICRRSPEALSSSRIDKPPETLYIAIGINRMPLLYRDLNNDFTAYRETFGKYTDRIETFRKTRSLEDLLSSPYCAYYVLSGCCRLLLSRPNGNEKVNAVLKEGSILQMYSRTQLETARSLFLFEPYPKVEMLVFSRKEYEAMLIGNPDIMFKILTFYDDLAISLQYDMGQILLSDGLKRVAGFLLSCAGTLNPGDSPSGDNRELTIAATQDTIASFIALDRTNVSKYLQKLKQKGIIEISRGRIVILDCPSLEKIVNE